jgi:hypothetical protein
MTDESQIDDLLDQWEDARENGRTVSLEELCRDHPALLTSMQKKIAALEAFERCVEKKDSQASIERSLEDESRRVSTNMPQSLAYDSTLIDLVQHERGGLGVVYRGVDEKLNRNVAIVTRI